METGKVPDPLSEKAIRADIYLHGHQAFEDRLLLSGKDLKKIKPALKIAGDFSPPKFPISGKDLEALGMAPGIEMGAKLKDLEQRWVESDFSLNKAALLKL